jgi:hypothetical protein
MSRRKLFELVIGEHRKQRGDRMDGQFSHPAYASPLNVWPRTLSAPGSWILVAMALSFGFGIEASLPRREMTNAPQGAWQAGNIWFESIMVRPD